MKRDPHVFVGHMLESIDLIVSYIHDEDRQSIERNSRALDAVVRRLEIIGEAARNLPDSFKAQHTNVRWQDLIDFRNVLVHEYFGIDLDILWTIATTELPDLKRELMYILEGKDSSK